MLIWCYDGIQRDGTIEIRLESVQQELSVPYRTIKDWWRLLKEGPFFCEQIDRGRRGWIVRMADEWVDWHVMKNNYPEGRNSALDEKKEQPSRPDEGQESALENGQGPVKAPSRPDEGRNSALETSAYKVLHDDQESGGGAKNGKPSKGTSPPDFFQKLAEVCNINLSIATKGQRSDLGEAASALSAAGATVEQLDAFSTWWWGDSNWRTRKAHENKRQPEAPRPREVQQEWGNAVLPAANGHKPGRGPPAPTASAIPADAHSTDTTARKLAEMIRERKNTTSQH